MSEKKIYYKKGYKYQLVKTTEFDTSIHPVITINTEYITLFKNGKLIIREGYCWDGPSGPAIDTKNFMRGSLAHDALYQLMRMELLPQSFRLQADEELGKICAEDGMSSFRRWYVVRELNNFGASAASPSNKKRILIAP